jgi:hypothetical protein
MRLVIQHIAIVTPKYSAGAGVRELVQWLGYGLDDWDSILDRGGNFSLRHRLQTDSDAHPASYVMGTRDSLYLG